MICAEEEEEGGFVNGERIKAETRVKAGRDNLRGTQATWLKTHEE